MLHSKKMRIVVGILLTLTMLCALAIPVFASEEAVAEGTESEAMLSIAEFDPEDNDSAAAFLAAADDYDAVLEDEQADYQTAAQTFIDNYSDNVEDTQEFTDTLNKAIKAVRASIPSYATLLALLPPVIAILLSLITKEVYSSLFIGILSGALLYAGGSLSGTIDHLVTDGFIASVADPYNIGILIFLVLLGAIVVLMNKSGGSAAFGRWAQKHIKSRVGAQLATVALGVLIFVDDYFNCLTVGAVMRPVTDKFKVSRSKLSYLIDATAAPVCIIAPISSWAAAVSGFAAKEGVGGFELFIRAIPYNFYAILTIVMMILLAVLRFDYGPMKKYEKNAINDMKEQADRLENAAEEAGANPNGSVWDLVAPVFVLIVACIVGLIYSGGFFTADSEAYKDFIVAFSSADASIGLAIGGLVGFIFSIIYFLIRRVINFKDCMGALPDGFNAMVPAILILVCAWTLKTMTDSLGAKICIAEFVRTQASNALPFVPAIVFAIGVGLSFATGTSWGTFGILIPIVLAIFGSLENPIAIIAVSACMAGAVCGDHCSPISDTTIMASAGAQANHICHVSTQLPYALTVAAVSFVGYIIAGFVKSAWICLPISIVLMVVTLFVLKAICGKEATE